MAQVRIHLDSRRLKSDGTFNVIFRITHNRKVYTINSGVSIEMKHWNEQKSDVGKSHPNSKLINLKLSREYFKIQQSILKIEDDFSIESLRACLNGNSNKGVETFKTFADSIIKQMLEVNRTGNAIVYQTAVNRFMEFCEKPNIKFSEINYALLQKFIHFLTLEGLKQNSISNYLRSIRALYNKAIKEELVTRAQYPFHDLKIKVEKTAKRAIYTKDITSLKKVSVQGSINEEMAVSYFLLSFYLCGASFTDLAYLKPNNYFDGRIEFRRRKTGKNYSIKVFPPTLEILQKLLDPKRKYLLPVLPDEVQENSLRAKRIIQQWIKTTNKYLKNLSVDLGIDPIATSYSARHSFASIAKRLGFSNELIAECLGHQYGNKITNIYLDSFETEVVDSMHQKVIEL
jgi:integrase/recombinase XerD